MNPYQNDALQALELQFRADKEDNFGDQAGQIRYQVRKKLNSGANKDLGGSF